MNKGIISLDKDFFFRIGRTILIGAVLIILVSISLSLVNGHYLDKRKQDAKVINMAGMQRTLSQKLAKSLYSFQPDATYIKDIQKDAELWNRVHNALRYGDENLDIAKPTNFLIDSILRDISPSQEDLYKMVKNLEPEGTSKLSLPGIPLAEHTFLNGMDAIVALYQKDVEEGIYLIKVTTYILTTAFVLLVLLGYYFILLPLIKGYSHLYKTREKEVMNMRSILDNTDDLIWSVDREYKLLSFNPAFAQELSKESGTLPKLGNNVLEPQYSIQEIEKRKAQYDRAFSGKSFYLEIEVDKGNETTYHELSFNPIFDKDRLVLGCSVYRRDITERKKAHQELEQSERFLQEAQKIANFGNWNWDMVRNKITWSDQLYRVFGQEPQEFEATYETLMEIIHPDDREAFNTDVENCITNKDMHDIVHRIVMKDGSIRFVHQKGTAFYDKEGKPYRMAGTTQDVTQIETGKQRIQRQYNELQNFVYVISHNVRSPIAMLLGLVDLLKIQYGDSDELITNIGHTMDALDTTIKDLNHALSLKNTSKESFTEVDLQEVMGEIERLLSGEIKNCGAAIKIDFSRAPKVLGIKSYVSNILYNLVLNALVYRAEERPPLINISSRLNSIKVVEIEVADNGAGMDLNKKERRKKIFDMYGRLSSATSGKGLGLYLVKTQVEAMGGTIGVESELDKGTVFTIVLTPND